MKIAIIGKGFVGTAVEAGFSNGSNELLIVDPKVGTTVEWALAQNPDMTFICVPTPMGENGAIDSSIVEGVLTELKDFGGLVVLKSTVVPSKIQLLEKMHPRFVYNPEFLTEANAVRDFLNPFMHVFGGKKSDVDELERIYAERSNCSKDVQAVKCTPVEASMIKYGINSFLALKVAFMNQWKDLCDSVGADYELVKTGMSNDPRIGGSHMMVPGPDGRRGFGSACFAKDLPAIINESMKVDSELSILRSAWNANCALRNSYQATLPREIEQNIKFNKI